MDLFSLSTAKFSPCRTYRYSLFRWWDTTRPYAAFICLNPSTADETQDDPTVRRCINYSKAWGFGGFCMLNLFGFRATDPVDMKAAEEPIGPDNDLHIYTLSKQAGIVVIAWGVHGRYQNRDTDVKIDLLKAGIQLHCLGRNADATPKHPLYLSKDLKPERY